MIEIRRLESSKGNHRSGVFQLLVRTNQESRYLNYSKGFVVMNALAEYIGEERLNGAIRSFIEKNAFREPPFPIAGELIDRFRAVTPDSLQYLIGDSFERIVLFDNEAVEASCRHTADGKYEVTLTFEARKWEVDGKGKESHLPLHDLVEFGVFGDDGDELCKRRLWITDDTDSIRMVVDNRPARAGIDPHFLLVDKKTDDNAVDVHME